jgi:hypothetical protein
MVKEQLPKKPKEDFQISLFWYFILLLALDQTDTEHQDIFTISIFLQWCCKAKSMGNRNLFCHIESEWNYMIFKVQDWGKYLSMCSFFIHIPEELQRGHANHTVQCPVGCWCAICSCPYPMWSDVNLKDLLKLSLIWMLSH